MKRLKGFTLAEVLITLAIIGVVAAISIPSVISNTQQQEFKTGLRKAVSVLNSAITMNMAIDGESPYDNADTFDYLMRHMAVMKSTKNAFDEMYYSGASNEADLNGDTTWTNAAFYTTDGMRFEFWTWSGSRYSKFALYENPNIFTCMGSTAGKFGLGTSCGGCGSYGLKNNTDGTTKPPCLITVDVNGDRRPYPKDINCNNAKCLYPPKYADPRGIKLTDIFSIMITDKQAIPYGVAAQRAMYQAQAKK